MTVGINPTLTMYVLNYKLDTFFCLLTLVHLNAKTVRAREKNF